MKINRHPWIIKRILFKYIAIYNTDIIIMTIIGAVIHKEKISKLSWVAIACMFTGVVIIKIVN